MKEPFPSYADRHNAALEQMNREAASLARQKVQAAKSKRDALYAEVTPDGIGRIVGIPGVDITLGFDLDPGTEVRINGELYVKAEGGTL